MELNDIFVHTKKYNAAYVKIARELQQTRDGEEEEEEEEGKKREERTKTAGR